MLPENIILTDSPGPDLDRFLAQQRYSKILVLADENTQQVCYPLIAPSLPAHGVLTIDSGEENKTLDTCEAIWQTMTDEKLDRHAVLIILGGGVPGDMGGFCAATYKRGIDFILIPTTLLAQADASIGGKLGIDFNNFKNHIGVFKQPALTLLHAGFLKTLPENELRSGFAEVIKHALISDKKLWDALRTRDLKNQDWTTLVKQSAGFKYSVIEQDPYEKGLRKILNAGHTIGHALESYFLAAGNKILHGEAVAAGLMAEAFIAFKKKMLDEPSLQQITGYILKVFGKLTIPEKALPEIAALCLQDKKNRGNSVLGVLPEEIGKARWDVEISLAELEDALKYYRSC
ncbi:MAG TPA: 3-dehydroquinate synthase [Cyclobacteriaceae bacterium]|nr:3-dehydroquinate synthase [Cyclobacteriaceae bacterium]